MMTREELLSYFKELDYSQMSPPPLDDVSRLEGEKAWEDFLNTVHDNERAIYERASSKRRRNIKGIVLAVMTGRDGWSDLRPGTAEHAKAINGMLSLVQKAFDYSIEHPYLVKPTIAYNDDGDPVMMTTFIPSKGQ